MISSVFGQFARSVFIANTCWLHCGIHSLEYVWWIMCGRVWNGVYDGVCMCDEVFGEVYGRAMLNEHTAIETCYNYICGHNHTNVLP